MKVPRRLRPPPSRGLPERLGADFLGRVALALQSGIAVVVSGDVDARERVALAASEREVMAGGWACVDASKTAASCPLIPALIAALGLASRSDVEPVDALLDALEASVVGLLIVGVPPERGGELALLAASLRRGDSARVIATTSRSVLGIPEAAQFLLGTAAAVGALERGDVEAALHWLDATTDVPLDGPDAAELARALAHSGDPRLERWRYEAAIVHGEFSQLGGCVAPIARDADTLAVWAEVRLLQGHVADASALIAELETRLVGPMPLRMACVRALVLAHGGNVALAVETLRSVVAVNDSEVVVRDAACAHFLGLAHRDEEALALVVEHWSSHRRLGGHARRRVVTDLLATLVMCERLDLARRYVEETKPEAVGVAGYFLALVLTHSGQLSAADAVISACERTFDPLGHWHARAAALRARWCLARGEYHGLDARLDGLARAAIRMRDRHIFAAVRVYKTAFAELVCGVSVEPLAWPEPLDRQGARADDWLDVLLGSEPPAHRHGRITGWRRIMYAWRALGAGHYAQALIALDDAIAKSRAVGFVLDEVLALRLRLDAAFLLGDEGALASTAQTLRELGAEVESRGVAADLELYDATSAPDPGFASLLRLATATHGECRTSRRARGSLGDTLELDALDAAVVTRMRVCLKLTSVSVRGHASHAWSAAVLVDHRSHTVFRAGASPVAMGTTPLLWKVLVAILEEGGASKEHLCAVGWGVTDYHPLRDDNRLQVTVRKLRGLIEQNPAEPRLLATAADGYALGDSLRIIELR